MTLVTPIGALLARPEDFRTDESRAVCDAIVDTWVACHGRMTMDDLKAGLEKAGVLPYWEWVESFIPPAERGPQDQDAAPLGHVRWLRSCVAVMAHKREIARLLAYEIDDSEGAAQRDRRVMELMTLCRVEERAYPGVTGKALAELAREATMPTERAAVRR